MRSLILVIFLFSCGDFSKENSSYLLDIKEDINFCEGDAKVVNKEESPKIYIPAKINKVHKKAPKIKIVKDVPSIKIKESSTNTEEEKRRIILVPPGTGDRVDERLFFKSVLRADENYRSK